MLSDLDFEPGKPEHWVAGNRARLLDPRRTPVRIVSLQMATGLAELEILDFEDKGARWWIPFERAHEYQFEKGSPRASPSEVHEIEAAIARLDCDEELPCSAEDRARSERTIGELRAEARGWLLRRGSFFESGGVLSPRKLEGPARLFDDFEAFLRERKLLDLERVFSTQFVSNPYSGELIKAHRLALARAGLCPYRGKILRDPSQFDGESSLERRIEHVCARIAFVREMLTMGRGEGLTLFRTIYNAETIEPVKNKTFVSWTFSEEVAQRFAAATHPGRVRRTLTMRVPVDRVFMTYFETRAMSEKYREAECALLWSERD